MTALMSPYTDADGITWYPVAHALGGLGYSLTEDSQRRWQELADKHVAELIVRFTPGRKAA